MGINLGAFLGPLLTGFLAQDEGFRALIAGWGMDPNSAWHWAFGAAGVGMTLGLIPVRRNGPMDGNGGAQAGRCDHAGAGGKSKRQAVRAGGGVALVVAVVLLALAGIVTISPTTVRDLTGYSLLVITVVFFASLFLDRSWTRRRSADACG